jgi:ABC-type transport system involved in multi-copper enzyme maturation permease subunit
VVPYGLHCLRVIWASLRKELKSALAERAFLFQMSIIAPNYCLLAILFALSGSNAPTAVVLQDRGPYAQLLLHALQTAHSFHLEQASAREASSLMSAGEIVAIVTVPGDFDQRLVRHQAVQVGLEVNNLQVDMTDDVRRGVRLAITTFAQQAFPGGVTITPEEHDAYPGDTGYVPFLAVSTLVLGIMVGGLLQAGTASAREWEKGTMRAILLAPAPGCAVAVGKMLAAWMLALGAGAIVLAFLLLVIGDWPLNWPLMLLVTLLTSALFVALGTALGSLLRQRQTLTLLARGCSVPLFFLSGMFAPLSFSTPWVQLLGSLSPVHYAIVLEQYSFLGYWTNTLGVGGNLLVLCGFLVAFVALAALALRRGAAQH